MAELAERRRCGVRLDGSGHEADLHELAETFRDFLFRRAEIADDVLERAARGETEEKPELIAGKTDLLLQSRIVDDAKERGVGIDARRFGALFRFLE